MAKITAAILQKIAPQTPAPLRDRFIPYLNEALPRYGIVSELQVAAFLATAAFESMYFRKTKEGKAKPTSKAWIRYQSKYWHTNYMGRGIFQTTSEKNYRIFGQKMKKKGLVTDSEIFVKQPQLLEQPQWAVESACEFWETNGLDKYARQGFKGFTALQGVVNRGSASKIALGQPDRLVVYERARLALPDNFILGASTTTADTTATDSNSPIDEPQDTSPPTNSEVTQNADTIINEESLVDKTSKIGDKFQSFQGVLDKFGFSIEDAKRSVGTVILTWFKAIGSALMVVGGVLLNHWELLVIAVLLAVLAYLLWDRSGKRVAEAKAGMPVEVAKEMLK